MSKDQQILKVLLSSEVPSTLINLDFGIISIERTVGILWNSLTDAFQIKVTTRDVPLTETGTLRYTGFFFRNISTNQK